MKTESTTTLALVSKLVAAIEARKLAEKLEKELKTDVKAIMGMNATLEAGDFLVLIEAKSRTDLDRPALIQDFGQDVVNRYLKVTAYEQLTIKAMVRSIAAIKEVI